MGSYMFIRHGADRPACFRVGARPVLPSALDGLFWFCLRCCVLLCVLMALFCFVLIYGLFVVLVFRQFDSCCFIVVFWFGSISLVCFGLVCCVVPFRSVCCVLSCCVVVCMIVC